MQKHNDCCKNDTATRQRRAPRETRRESAQAGVAAVAVRRSSGTFATAPGHFRLFDAHNERAHAGILLTVRSVAIGLFRGETASAPGALFADFFVANEGAFLSDMGFKGHGDSLMRPRGAGNTERTGVHEPRAAGCFHAGYAF